MNSDQTFPWLVLRTRSRQERVVGTCLTRKGIPMFLPRRKEIRIRNHKRRLLESPLFPGYIFVQPSPCQIEHLRFIPGSCGLIFNGNQPAIMPEKDLEGIRIMVLNAASLTVNSELVVGRKVRVLSGPFAGVCGELVQIKNQRRLLINAHLLCKSVCVEIDTDEVRPL